MLNASFDMRHRVILKQRLRPGQVETYLRAHENIWPELEAEYRDLGVTDFSCFIHGRDILIFVETDPERVARAEGYPRPQDARWQQLMERIKDQEFGSVEYEEFYRMPMPEDCRV